MNDLYQSPVLGMAHHWEVGRKVQCDQPWAVLWSCLLMPLSLGLLSSQSQSRLWKAINERLVCDELLEGLCGIQDVVAELGGQLAQFLLDLIEALTVSTLHT